MISAVERIRSDAAHAEMMARTRRRTCQHFPAACETSRPDDRRQTAIASYQADPEQVGRVLLLYSGGLDTA